MLYDEMKIFIISQKCYIIKAIYYTKNLFLVGIFRTFVI